MKTWWVAAAAACAFFAMSSPVRAEMFVSDRTVEDMKESEAAALADCRKENSGPRCGGGSFVDPAGLTWKYGYVRPAKIEPGVQYPLFLGNVTWALAASTSQAQYPCYVMAVYAPAEVISPNGKGAYNTIAVYKSVIACAYKVAVDKVIADNPSVDASRVWVEGASKFGATALLAAWYYPDTFAAVMPPVGGGDLCKARLIASRKIGIWVFYGVRDGGEPDFKKAPYGRTAPYIYKALTEAGLGCNYTKYTGGDHHEYGFSDSLKNPEWNDFTKLRKWLFAQKKPAMDWPVITSATMAGATVGKPFTCTVAASNAPKSFAASGCVEHAEDNAGKIKDPNPPLPKGLTFDAKTGVLSGAPEQAGTFLIRLTATNDKGDGLSTLMLTVKDP